MRFMEWLQSTGKIHHGNSYLWSVMKKSSVSRTRRCMSFQILCLCLGKMNQNPTSNSAWEEKLSWFKSFITIQNFGHNWWWADGIWVEYFPRIHHIAALQQSPKSFMSKTSDPLEFKGRIIFMSMFNDISWWCEDNERECSANADLVSKNARRFPAGRWSFLGSEKKVVFYSCWQTTRRMGTESLCWWRSNSEKADTQFSEPRVHCPRGTLKSKRRWEIINTLLCWCWKRLKLFFAQ